MAAVASASAAAVRSSLVQSRPFPAASPTTFLLGLPALGKRGGVRCCVDGKANGEVENNSCNLEMGASLIATACAATMSSPAMALVDERLSTEGTGLPFGLSNNLLGWILLGVFGFIWTFYIVYTSTLEEDEESGLSL
ncbi:photosystem II reaction center W protein, chloroplastic-like isoform X2 [Cucurbita pepo subsp. pepo]|uniref:photosystem II reaction center W protein, chloroplastic-like isoform X2 n=1 Tax=Cucurbita pepo subsp. pepo TaxID=3664 RepID=UPI000C9D29D9|nr:photosystem II reaction center W protein, chloroplastic-like isoform X2 [Cucurbita pepo subsp. pepo]